jgi:predicted transcriptional regulator
MTRRLIELRSRPILDIASYARRGPAERTHLAPEEIQLLSRTAHRTSEVMVKVLTKGGHDRKAVGRHLSYLSRVGKVEIETDDGRHLSGEGVEQELLEDWDLDLEEARRTSVLRSRPGIAQPKLVHKVVFSMPAGTPPDGLLRATRTFARETFGAKHRYAMVLHTDEPHPHVHMVIKAESEYGIRLNIRKATLRNWRREFARHLRAQGISANATDKAVRGATRPNLSDGMYRAMQRGASRNVLWHLGAPAMEPKTAAEALGKTHCCTLGRRWSGAGWPPPKSWVARVSKTWRGTSGDSRKLSRQFGRIESYSGGH